MATSFAWQDRAAKAVIPTAAANVKYFMPTPLSLPTNLLSYRSPPE
jgi:hypothetical protein